MQQSTAAGIMSGSVLLLTSFLMPAHSRSVADRAAGTLSATGAMQHPRASHTASLLGDGTVLVAGGFAGSGFELRPYASTELYQPASGTFSPGPPMTEARSGHAAVTLKDGRILLVGGWSGNSGVTNAAEIYDPTTRRFSRVGNMAEARGECTGSLLADGRVLVTGGVDRADRALASAEIFDPQTNLFSSAGSMTAPRSQHSATVLRDGSVLVVGGGSCDCAAKTVWHTAEVYEPIAGKFVPVGSLSEARYKHTSVLLQDGRVLVAGGADARDWGGLLSSAELYETSSRSFQRISPLKESRFKFPQAALRLKSGEVLIAGGAPAAEVFRPKQQAFVKVTGGFDAARYFASATLLDDGRVLVLGGYSEGSGGLPATSRAWLYRP